MAIHPRNLYIAVLLTLSSLRAFAAEAVPCERLSQLNLPDTTITLAESVPAGDFTPPYGDRLEQLPAFCRVMGVIKPTSDSNIRFEVWLPDSHWNEKYLGWGNGGFAGGIDFRGLGGNLKRGYATAGTDTGHEAEGIDASWALHHPEKVADFGFRGLHLTTLNAKQLIEAFYAHPAHRAFFDACSDGGREALMEAQRFPEDFDGILAGAPANFWTNLLSSGVYMGHAMYADPESYISSVKLPAISAAVLKACDAQDGVKDGIVSDPVHCRFDPAVLLCKGADSRDCLTAPQIDSLKKLYAGGRTSRGEKIMPGYLPGSEEGQGGWGPWILGEAPGLSAGAGFTAGYFRYIVFEDPAWNIVTANVDDALRAAQKTAQELNATDPDLSRFEARGGKLILYHGWNDPAIPALNTIDYYNSVIAKMGAPAAATFTRLYMVPGMQHCFGGPGATSFGQLGTTTAEGPERGIYASLEAWVEKGVTPNQIIATKYTSADKVEMTRPLCPYPEIAQYKGSGDTNDYRNFVCAPGK